MKRERELLPNILAADKRGKENKIKHTRRVQYALKQSMAVSFASRIGSHSYSKAPDACKTFHSPAVVSSVGLLP